MTVEYNKRFNKAFSSLDVVSDYLKGDITTFRIYSSKIERTARELCDDNEGNKIEFSVEENGNVLMDTIDEEAIECLFKSLERHEKSIPHNARMAIQQMLDKYKHNRAKLQSNQAR